MWKLPVKKQLIFDVLIFVVVFAILLLLHTLGKPVLTGFWCHDLSLSYPYKPDTISQPLLMVVSFGAPFLVITATESVRAAVSSQKSPSFRSELLTLVKTYIGFLFGMTINLIFTLVLKLCTGRLRPHFFDVCKPDFDKLNCTTDDGTDRLFNKILTRPATYSSDDKTNTLLDTRDMCGDVDKFDALLIVHTAVTHFQHRQKYRDTYGNYEFTRPYRLKIVFFLGLPGDGSLQAEILRENTQDGDTVQGNFTDTYRNLTHKAVMAYRWVSQNCRRVKVILKMDDDVIFDVHRFFEEFVLPPVYQQELIYCHIWKMGGVERTGKWGISLLEFKADYYPPYCSGFIVVVMPAIVEDLYVTARDTPFLWLDDVFIYGVVREEMRDVQLVNLDEVAYREEHYKACYRQYGYRCKYWATVLPDGKEFISTLMWLRAERLRTLAEENRRQLWNTSYVSVTSGGQNIPRLFIMEYTCTNTVVREKWIEDSRLSFPSGHASVAMFAATFTVFYLQLKIGVSFSSLLKMALQACAVLVALFCCVTRVTDHKHFPTDVTAGCVIGVCLAWTTFYKMGQWILPNPPSDKLPRLHRATSIESEPQTPTPLLRPDRIVVEHHYTKDSIPGVKADFVHKI